MPDWTISGPDLKPTSAHTLAARLAPALAAETNGRTWILHGNDQAGLAAVADLALQHGHRAVLPPPNATACHAGPHHDLRLPTGHTMSIDPSPDGPSRPARLAGADTRRGWDLALFTSGSATGRPRGYGHTLTQLAAVTGWYQTIYNVTSDSIIVTALPAHYNFTFIAGVLLAARLGARLHFASALGEVLTDAAQLAPTADRVIVLANPVVLDQATPALRLPTTVMIDSGGAPLSTSAITDYRGHGIDVREGYGLTETGSLTHFDTQATAASLGTVGTAMPGVATTIASEAGRPLIEVTGPATAIPLNPAEPHLGRALRTTDLGRIDAQGHLRLLGRADDHPIAGLWPHDTLDALGPLLGRRCALIRHPTSDQVNLRILAAVTTKTANALIDRAAELLNLPRDHITISSQGKTPLLHSAKLTRASAQTLA